MKVETTLPEDYDGTFRFTNWTDEDFVAKWDSKEYTFPAQTTSPMIIPNQTALEIQQIRKKFAKDLAEREFTKVKAFKDLLKQERNPDGTPKTHSIFMAAMYTISALTPLIQRALEPLPVSRANVKEASRPKLEDSLSRNSDGELNTEVIDKKTSLREKALNAK